MIGNLKDENVLIITTLLAVFIIIAGCQSLPGGSPRAEEQSTTSNVRTEIATVSGTRSSTMTSTIEPTQTPTLIQTATPTAIPPTARPTPTPTPTDPYSGFKFEFDMALKHNAEVPLRIRSVWVPSNASTIYVVLNATAPSVDQTRHAHEWLDLARAYATAVTVWYKRDWDGKVPERMVALDLNTTNYENPPGTFTVRTEDVRALDNESISIYQFHDRWHNTSRPQTDEEEAFAEYLDRVSPNRTYHDTDD
jgi:hypothetical protein